MNPQTTSQIVYPISMTWWRVLRQFSICPEWQQMTASHELEARRVYDGHRQNLGKGQVCLVGPDGRVVEGGAA